LLSKRKWEFDSIKDVRAVRDGVFEIQVLWMDKTLTWEPFDVFMEDVPDAVGDFLKFGVPAASKGVLEAIRRSHKGGVSVRSGRTTSNRKGSGVSDRQ
jgi:hypothetical protein